MRVFISKRGLELLDGIQQVLEDAQAVTSAVDTSKTLRIEREQKQARLLAREEAIHELQHFCEDADYLESSDHLFVITNVSEDFDSECINRLSKAIQTALSDIDMARFVTSHFRMKEVHDQQKEFLLNIKMVIAGNESRADIAG